MQTKTYFASNVPSALEVARQELGPEALLLNSRPAPDEMRQFGRLEVTFAWDHPRRSDTVANRPKLEPLTAYSAGTVGGQPGHFPYVGTLAAEPPARQGGELDDIRQQLSALRIALSHPSGQSSEPRENPLAVLLADKLRDLGLSGELSADLAQRSTRKENVPDRLRTKGYRSKVKSLGGSRRGACSSQGR